MTIEWRGRFVAVLLGVSSAGQAAAAALAPPTMDELVKRPQYESVSISPDGEYLAVGMPMDDRSVLGILRRDDGKISTIVNPGPDGFVDSAFWVGDRRVFVEWSMRFGAVAQPYGTGTVYSTDVDGSNRRLFSGSVINPLLHDADNVQIVTYPKVVNRKS